MKSYQQKVYQVLSSQTLQIRFYDFIAPKRHKIQLKPCSRNKFEFIDPVIFILEVNRGLATINVRYKTLQNQIHKIGITLKTVIQITPNLDRFQTLIRSFENSQNNLIKMMTSSKMTSQFFEKFSRLQYGFQAATLTDITDITYNRSVKFRPICSGCLKARSVEQIHFTDSL